MDSASAYEGTLRSNAVKDGKVIDMKMYTPVGYFDYTDSFLKAVQDCFFNLRYPFWHDCKLKITDSEMTENCRAALWYSSNVEITDSRLHGIKALRECRDVLVRNCDIIPPELFWYGENITVKDSTVKGEYLTWYSEGLTLVDCKIIGTQPFCYCKKSAADQL